MPRWQVARRNVAILLTDALGSTVASVSSGSVQTTYSYDA